MAIYDPNPLVVYAKAYGTSPQWGPGLWNTAGVGYADGPAIFYASALQCITPDGVLHTGGGALWTLCYAQQHAAIGFDTTQDKWIALGTYYAGQAYFDASNNLIEQTRFVPAVTAITGVLNNWGILGGPSGSPIPWGGVGIAPDHAGGFVTWTNSPNWDMGYVGKDGVLTVLQGAQYNTNGTGNGWIFSPLGPGTEYGNCMLYFPRTRRVAMCYNNPSAEEILQMDLTPTNGLAGGVNGTVVSVPVANSCVYAGQLFGGFAFSGVFGQNSNGLFYTEDGIRFRPIVDAAGLLDFTKWYNFTKCRLANAFGKTYIANFGTMYTSNPGDPPQPTAGAYVLTLGTSQANPNSSGTSYCHC